MTTTKTATAYRKVEQFSAMRENVQNGNWRDAAKIGESGGWYSSDILEFNDSYEYPFDMRDLVILVEMIQELR